MVIECILENGPDWELHNGHFIGVGHSDMGIVTQITLSDPPYAPKSEAKVSELLDPHTESGT
jgi:hypothetical protein